jgi:hypothetical protein
VVAGLGGIFALGLVFGSAIQTLLLPRGVHSRLARFVFIVSWQALSLRLGRSPSFERRDRVYAYLGPVYLLCLVATWLVLLWLSFALIFWSVTHENAGRVFITSSSSLTTLGFVRPPGVGSELLAALEAIVGLALVALLISYLPALYSAFSRREAAVNKLAIRAGSPPSGPQLLGWSWRFDQFQDLSAVWRSWEDWFGELGETHTSFPVLASFRSPRPGQSWITAAGAVLDAAALRCSAVDAPRDIDAELCIRAGFQALREISDLQNITYDPDPRPGDSISVVRAEFDEACALLKGAGVSLREDREAAWGDFAGWRVNYDRVLVSLATVTMAPFAPWSSDRSVSRFRRPPMLFLRTHPRRSKAGTWD